MSNERFIVDTNTFITPFKTYYPFDFAPSFWQFLKTHIENGNIIILSKIFDEVVRGTDELSEWIKTLHFTPLDHRASDILYSYGQVMSHIQNGLSLRETKLYNDKALQEWADNYRADAWLVAAAKAKEYTLITFERPNSSLGTSISGNPKIPDVAKALDVKCGSLYDVIRKFGLIF